MIKLLPIILAMLLAGCTAEQGEQRPTPSFLHPGGDVSQR